MVEARVRVVAHWNWSAGQGESQVEPRGQQAARVVVVGLMMQLGVGVSVWGGWGAWGKGAVGM